MKELKCRSLKDLIKLTGHELVEHERVKAAYWGLTAISVTERFCPVDELDPIPGSLADVAFEMRDAIVTREIAYGSTTSFGYQLSRISGHGDTYGLLLASPKEWIIAAVLAWEAQK